MSTADVDVRVAFQWTSPTSVTREDQTGHLALPDRPNVPGVYRWILHAIPGRSWNNDRAIEVGEGEHTASAAYIGEAGDLRARTGRYLRPSKTGTAGRLHQLLVTHLEGGGHITLEWATEAQLTIGGGSTVPLQMHRQTARRLAEGTAIVVTHADDRLYVLNHELGGPKPGDRVMLLDGETLTPVRREIYRDNSS